MSSAPNDIRHHLRHATRPRHDRVDTLYGSLDLADKGDYRRFLRAHLLAIDAIETLLGEIDLPAPFARLARPDFGKLIRADLTALDGDPPRQLPPRRTLSLPSGPLPPLAGAGLVYVVAGSRLGAQFLLSRLCQAGATLPASYLSAPAGIDLWKGCCRALDALGTDLAVPGALTYDTLTSGAETGFSLFEEAFQVSKLTYEPARQ